MLTAAHKSRLIAVIAVFCLAALALWGRLLWLQVLEPDHWVSLARRQQIHTLELPPTRGDILDRNGVPLAVSVRLSSVFADPRHVRSPARAARVLSPLLGMPEARLQQRLSRKGRGFVWLKRKIPNGTADQIRKLGLGGIHVMREPQRVYPNGFLAGHVIGFAGIDAQGLEGIELAYDPVLKGEAGWCLLPRDARRRPIGAWQTPSSAPRDGLDLVLTLDTTLQFIAESALDRAWRESNARSASLILMDPSTGEILALANRPTFDPNRVGERPAEFRRNRAVTDPFEPGSVFKVITAAVALGTGTVTPDRKFFCENGEYPVAGRILHDHKPHGWLTFREVITRSSNIGTAKAAMEVGPQRLYRGIRAFGFGEPTGVELPGEAPGKVKPPREWSKPSITVIPMGHEVSVTALQLAQAVSVVANGGYLVRPRVVREIREPDSGAVVRRFSPQVRRRVLTPECVAVLREILAGVVEEGTGQKAAIPGVRVAGKTGTAQKVEPGGGYSHSRFIASFVGFFPVEDPRLAMVVTFDEPWPVYYGGSVAAPVFSEVGQGALAYLRRQGLPAPFRLAPLAGRRETRRHPVPPAQGSMAVRGAVSAQ